MAKNDELRFKVIATDDASVVLDGIGDKADDLEKLSPEVEVTADDKATKDIQSVGDKAEALDKLAPEVEISADDKASDDIEAVSDRLKKLPADVQKLVLEADAKKAEREIATAERSLRNFHKLSEKEVQVLLDARDRASAKLDAVQSDIREIDGSTPKVTLEADTSALDALDGKLGGVGDQIAKLGPALANPYTAAVALGGALLLAGDAAADVAIEAETMATLTGDSVEDASRLQQVWKQTGADTGDLNDVILQMMGALGDNEELARKLGINLNDGRTGAQRFVQVMEKLRNFTGSAADKAKAMSALLGEEGARQGAKLLAMTDNIGESVANIDEAIVVTPEQVAEAKRMKQETAELKAEFTALAAEAGNAVVPALGDVLGILNEIAGIEISGVSLSEMSGYNAIKKIAAGDNIEGVANLTTNWERLNGALLAGAGASGEVASAADIQTAKLEELRGEIDANREAQLAFIDASRANADSTFALQEAQDNWSNTLESVQSDLDAAKGDTEAYNKVLRDGTKDATAVADAEKRKATDMIAATGATISAKDQQDVWNNSMLRSAATAEGPLRDSIIGYIAEANQIPAEKVTEIEAAIAAGDLAEAERLLDEASKTRKAAIEADAQTTQAEKDLNYLARDRTVTVKAQGRLGAGFNASGDYSVDQSGSYVVGEHGPERVWLNEGDRVSTAAQTLGQRPGAGTVTNITNVTQYVAPMTAREQRRLERQANRRGYR